MDISQLIELLKRVLLTPEVIGVTVVMIAFFSLVNFVVYYRKKPAPPQPKKPATDVPAPAKGAVKTGEKEPSRPGDEDEEEAEEKADAKKKKGGKRGKKADKGAKEETEEE